MRRAQAARCGQRRGFLSRRSPGQWWSRSTPLPQDPATQLTHRRASLFGGVRAACGLIQLPDNGGWLIAGLGKWRGRTLSDIAAFERCSTHNLFVLPDFTPEDKCLTVR